MRFSDRKRQAAKKYREFVEAGIEGVENPFEEVEAGLILGDGGFKAAIQRMLDAIRGDEELRQIKRLKEGIPLETVVIRCAEYYGTAKEDIVKIRRGMEARQMAVYLSKRASGKTNKVIGEYFGVKGVAISKLLREVEERLEKDTSLQKKNKELKERILSVK